MRNVEQTKQRLLEAATAEFSEHGFHGARVDRIASNASANKALLYAYFGNKEELFAAVYQESMRQVVQDVPIDATDLPGYLARRLDWQYRHPALARIVMWGTLELEEFPEIAGAVAVRTHKLERIADAQQRGIIGASFAPQEVLDLIDALARPTLRVGRSGAASEETFERYKLTAVSALRKLIAPE
jgi:AcrR family transcriptional regulator